MRFNDLRRTTRLPLAGDSKVDNGEHDIRAIADGLVARAEDADSEQSPLDVQRGARRS
jgi:hypothetical protein